MRLDLYLVEKHLVKTRSQGTDLIKRGLVMVDQYIITKPGYDIHTEHVSLIEPLHYVSRGGEKLKHAINTFQLDLKGKIMIDIGSSTGGFTDCALQEGAKEVYAYDVGTDQMDPSLRQDKRVHLFEQTNILEVQIPEADLITIDVSFTSIKPILSHIQSKATIVIALIKPQFEVGRLKMKSGVLKDIKKHKQILEDIISYTEALGFGVLGLTASEIKGKSGNQEYLAYIKKGATSKDVPLMIRKVL